MRRLIFLTTAIIFLSFAWTAVSASPATDLKVIKKRLYTSMSTGNPSATEVDKIMGNLDADGQFSDVDYDDTAFNSGGDKRKHILNLTKLVKGYVNSSDAPHFKNKQLYNSITTALRYWVDANLQDENWWHRIIGFPKDLMVPLVLIGDDLKRFDPELFDKCVNYELYSWSQPKQRAQEGANGTDICKITFTTAVITGNDQLLSEVIEKVNSLIRIVDGPKDEGIQTDYSFSQHTGSGRQLYLGTYGYEYIDGLLYFMELIRGTSFQYNPEKVAIVEHLFLEGLSWPWYKNEFDISQCGRAINRANNGPVFVKQTKRLYDLETPRQGELKVMLDQMAGKSELTGNKMYWRHDYMIHRGKNYFTTARMTSTRTVGNEAGNGEGFNNYHTGDGANYIKVSGTEYAPIYASWNWKRIPGTTVIADTRTMPKPMWGAGGEGGSDFASGASDGVSGVSAFIYSKDSLQAHKSWFFFDRYFVALGAGISSVRGDAPAVTTVNQTALAGDVLLFDATGTASKLDAQSSNVNKLWHNDVGYSFAKGNAPFSVQADKSGKTGILWIACDHGVAPQNGTYAYAVYPAMDSKSFAEQKDEYTILSNTAAIQAIADNATGKIMVAFYEPATLSAGKVGEISVDKPTIMIVEPKGDKMKITVANPFCESRQQGSVTVNIKGASHQIEFKDSGNNIEI